MDVVGKVDRRWRPAATGYTLIPVLLCLRNIHGSTDPRTYGPSHWFLNYKQGFIRRALFGQAFSGLPYLSWRYIHVVEAVIVGCALAFTYYAFRALLFGSDDERVFSTFLLSAPAVLPHLAYMSGEMDNVLYIVVVLCGILLVNVRGIWSIAATTCLVLIGLAVHEGFLLMFYPLVFALIVELVWNGAISRRLAGLHVIVVCAFFVALLRFGKVKVAEAVWLSHAQQRTDMPIDRTVFLALHNTLTQQVHFVAGRYTSLLLRGIAITLLLCIPYGIMLWTILKAAITTRQYSRKVQNTITALLFSPLLLLPLGHDAMRWVSALCINVSLYALFIHQLDTSDLLYPSRKEQWTCFLERWSRRPATIATYLYLVALGPWSLVGSHVFSNLNNLLK